MSSRPAETLHVAPSPGPLSVSFGMRTDPVPTTAEAPNALDHPTRL